MRHRKHVKVLEEFPKGGVCEKTRDFAISIYWEIESRSEFILTFK